MKQLVLILGSLFFAGIVFGQTDSVKKAVPAESSKTTILQVPPKKTIPRPDSSIEKTNFKDSLLTDSLKKDSIKAVVPIIPVAPKPDTITYQQYYQSAWLPFEKTPVFEIEPERKPAGMDLLFYVLTGLVTILACIRLIFPKYLKNLFLLFLQTSIRQKQTREQLLQNNLASVLLNVFFVASAGLYSTLFIQFKQWAIIPFYPMLFYSMAVLMVVYLGKYLFLAFSGWVFNVPEATNAYTFVVFLVNKVLGIVLIPFILLITFSPLPVKQVAITISAGLAGLLFVYRYLISFGVIRSNLKVSALHFFLYLCAVELLPLLLIYKLLVNFVSVSI